MYIYGESNVDKQRRIVMTSFFDDGEVIPKKIYLAIDPEVKMIAVFKEDEVGNLLPKIKMFSLDESNRIVLPTWLSRETRKSKKVYFVFHEGKKYLLPRTENIL